MLDYVSVLVPYRPDAGFRDRAWSSIRPAWEALGVDLVIESPGSGESPADFNHPRAINRARERATGEVLIVADADTGFDSAGWVLEAARLVRDGFAYWALASEYWQLSATQTRDLQRPEGRAPSEREVAGAEWVGFGNAYSGIVVVSVEGFDEVGGYDERFAWWGADDGAFAITMTNLVGPPTRLRGRCLHHWHPRPQEMHAHQGAQHALTRRYQAADGDVADVRRVRFQ